MNTRLIIYALMAGLAWALAGCNAQLPKITPTSTAQAPSPSLQTSKPVPTATSPQPTRQSNSENDESVERLPRPTITPTPIPTIPAPPGLMYTTDDGQWFVAQDGTRVKIIDDRCASVSPDRTMAVMSYCAMNPNRFLLDLRTGVTATLTEGSEYVWSPDSRQLFFPAWNDSENQQDIWIRDLVTGAARNLSNTHDRNEERPRIWAVLPDTVVFLSWPAGKMLDGEYSGNLTVIKTDGTGYKVIHEGHFYGGDPTPDGQHIAFALFEEDPPLWLYSNTSGKLHAFPFDEFGLTAVSNVSVPIWSPDGKRLALWGTFTQNSKKDVTGLGVFDLDNSRWTVLDQMEPIPAVAPYNDPVWSLGGNWLTVFTTEQDTQQRGIWLVNTKNWDTRLLIPIDDNFCSQAWSPDERWLALNCSREGVKSAVRIIDPLTLQQSLTDLPLDAEITGWIKP